MRKQARWIAAALLAAVCAAAVCLETRFVSYEVRALPLSEEAMRREMPDLELTEEELALGERLRQAPEIRTLLDTEESGTLPEAVSRRLTEGYLPEESTELSCGTLLSGTIYVDYMESPEKRVMLEIPRDRNHGMTKSIALYGERDGRPVCSVLYANESGQLKKYKEQRRWFAFFRDRMWEE